MQCLQYCPAWFLYNWQDSPIFCSDALLACPPFNLVWNSIVRSTIFCNQVPKVWEHIHLLQLFILNEYAARYAIARHYLGLVDIDE